MVDIFSAALNLPQERRFPIDEDHTNMVKFPSENTTAYQTVVSHVKACSVYSP